MTHPSFLEQINFFRECRRLHWGLWQCPPFLMIANGFVAIVAMIATYLFASRYVEEPEVAALIVMGVAALFIIVGYFVVHGFNTIAEAHRIKSEFISIVSHQLRSPLSIFKWTLDILEREYRKRGGDSPDLDNLFSTLTNSTEGMIRLVNMLLEVSRIESETAIFKKNPIDLAQHTKKIMEDFQSYARASNVTLALDAPEDLPRAAGDPERIAMAIQNLIDNAIRYTLRAGKVLVSIRKEGAFLRWSVTDQGIGVSSADEPFVFQKFFRAQNAVREQVHGSGIGLYIVKVVVEAAGGGVGFHSQEGAGSTFWFILPMTNEK